MKWLIIVVLCIVALIISKHEIKETKWLKHGPLQTYCSGRSVLGEYILNAKETL
jgi:hypothetical protein